MQLARIEPFLQFGLLQVRDHSGVFERDHVHFCRASRTPCAQGTSALHDQQGIGFDGDPRLLCHKTSFTRWTEPWNESRLPLSGAKCPLGRLKTSDNFSQSSKRPKINSLGPMP